METVKEITYPELKGDLQIPRVQKVNGKSRMKKKAHIQGYQYEISEHEILKMKIYVCTHLLEDVFE